METERTKRLGFKQPVRAASAQRYVAKLLSSRKLQWALALCAVVCASCNTPKGSVLGTMDPPKTILPPPPPPVSPSGLQGVLMWKGDATGMGLNSKESKLTPVNVNVTAFGRIAAYPVDGFVVAQPLYVSQLDLGSKSLHDIVIVATEHDSVYAYDLGGSSTTPLWVRNYAVNGDTPAPDNYGGRTTLGGEIGITGTPVIDPVTGTVYFVTMQVHNHVIQQWLRAVDARTGKDFGPGSVLIQASAPGDGRGSSKGQIAFDPSIQNQRTGLVLSAGKVLIAWGSFSDWGLYHGWLMAYDAATLNQAAVFNSTTQSQAVDPADGPADHGGGGSFWQGGASPTVDSSGNIYLIAGDGSFNADQSGNNYGDTVLKLQLNGGSFQIADWYSPSNEACVDLADLEIGSGGLALLPSSIAPGRSFAITTSKEGSLYLLDTNNLGKYNPAGDTQIPQQFLVGKQACSPNTGSGEAEGPNWNRLYGNPSYWNNNLYLAPANESLLQYQFNGASINTTPLARSSVKFGLRGASTVVSANGIQNGIVWGFQKDAVTGRGILHAFDATNVSHELWNSEMSGQRDAMGLVGSFGVPVVADGRIITGSQYAVNVYGQLPQ